MDREIGEEIPLNPLLKQGKINKGKKNIRKKKQNKTTTTTTTAQNPKNTENKMRELYHCRFAAEESVARQILFAL